MHPHRFLDQVERFILPQAPVPAPTQGSFMALPLALGGAGLAFWQFAVYQRAFEQAQAVVRPSLLERDLLGVWN
jgi:hypothetical protein